MRLMKIVYTSGRWIVGRPDIRATYGAVGGVTVDGVYEFVDVEVVSVIAVSYTHLTLPTKRIV